MNKKISKTIKIFIYSDVCDGRNLDAKKVYTYFVKNNYTIINDPKKADYIIFFTCAYVNGMTNRCLRTINKFKNYDAELIVAGCLPEIAREKLKKIFNGKILITKNLNNIDDIFCDNAIKFKDLNDEHLLWQNFNPIGISEQPIGFFRSLIQKFNFFRKIYNLLQLDIIENFASKIYPLNKLYYNNQKQYYLTISRGCIHNCSYCNITKAIGSLKSKPIKDCINEFKLGLDLGYKHFILEADDIGHYGIDIGTNLPELLDEITKINGEYGIELKTIHPMWIINYIEQLEEILKREKIKSILISIQSGNNRILKLMRRSYTKENLLNIIPRLKKAYPGLEIKTYFIIGFPGETREEFRETLDLIGSVPIDQGLLFSFSSSDGAEADDMEPKITNEEIRKRMKMAFTFLKIANYYSRYLKLFECISFNSK